MSQPLSDVIRTNNRRTPIQPTYILPFRTNIFKMKNIKDVRHSTKLPGIPSQWHPWTEVLWKRNRICRKTQIFPFFDFFDFQCFIFSFILPLLDALGKGQESPTSMFSLVLTSTMYDFSSFCPFLKMLCGRTRDKVA